MQLEPHVGQLRRDLVAAAAGGAPEVVEAADRLARLLEPAVRLVLLDAVGAAVAELNAALAERVDSLGALVTADLRLRGRDPELVLDLASVQSPRTDHETPAGQEKEDPSGPPGAGQPFEVDDDGIVTRVTLRLPEGLKTMVDSAADIAGTSLNAYVTRTLADALRGRGGPTPPPAPPGRSGSRVRGWVR